MGTFPELPREQPSWVGARISEFSVLAQTHAVFLVLILPAFFFEVRAS